MELLGYLLAIVMGLILGLLGGGGSILTVPILVYFFNISALIATGYSLFIVGSTSLFSALKYRKDNLLDFKVALIFSIPAAIGVLTARKFILPLLGNKVNLLGFMFTKDQIIMLVFACLILAISFFMFKAKEIDSEQSSEINKTKAALYITLEGLGVGIITGFVGAGGGFLIVPTLHLVGKIPLRKAIATSLIIIAIKSLIGFLGDMSNGMEFDFLFLIKFFAITLIGAFMGTSLNKRINVVLLRKGFAYFIVIVGGLILVKEFL